MATKRNNLFDPTDLQISKTPRHRAVDLSNAGDSIQLGMPRAKSKKPYMKKKAKTTQTVKTPKPKAQPKPKLKKEKQPRQKLSPEERAARHREAQRRYAQSAKGKAKRAEAAKQRYQKNKLKKQLLEKTDKLSNDQLNEIVDVIADTKPDDKYNFRLITDADVNRLLNKIRELSELEEYGGWIQDNPVYLLHAYRDDGSVSKTTYVQDPNPNSYRDNVRKLLTLVDGYNWYKRPLAFAAFEKAVQRAEDDLTGYGSSYLERQAAINQNKDSISVHIGVIETLKQEFLDAQAAGGLIS